MTDSPGRRALLTAALAELEEHGRAGISLRAVARRAGVSHAAPAHHFSDRAGLMTALAADGFRDLARSVRAAGEGVPGPQVFAALGHAYIEWGLTHPALFDLMFRQGELRGGDEELAAAQDDAFGALVAAAGEDGAPPRHASHVAMAGWALAHGLVVLARDGALGPRVGTTDDAATAELAHGLLTVLGPSRS